MLRWRQGVNVPHMEHSGVKTPTTAMRFGSGFGTHWPLLLAAGVFLLARPYEGFVHDARLYLGFAVAPLDPSGIGSDLLFQADQQSGRSLYPPLLRALVDAWSPSMAALLTTAVSLGLWFSGLCVMVRALWPALPASGVAALVMVAGTIHTYYGGSTTFHYAESFASPRVLAESLVLWALSRAVRKQWIAAVGLLALAMLVHPLMAIGAGAVVAWMAITGVRWRATLLATVALGATAVVLSAMTDVVEFFPFRTFDAEWLAVLDAMGSLVFLHNWEPLDWARMAVHLCTATMAWTVLSPASRPLSAAVVLVSVGGLVLTWAGADVAHNQLVTQAQPWRALWLLAVMASLWLGLLIQHCRRMAAVSYTALDGYRRTAVVLLVLAWFMLATSPSAATLAFLAVLLWWLPVVRPSLELPARLPALLILVMPVLLLALVGTEAWVVGNVYAASPDASLLWHWPTIVASGVMRLLGFALAWFLLDGDATTRDLDRSAAEGGPTLRASGTNLTWQMVSVAMLGSALCVFDSRAEFERELERRLDWRVAAERSERPPAIVDDLPPGPVFWPDGEMETWAFFGRPGYASVIQGTPRVFSRSLAIQWADRWKRVAELQSRVRSSRYRLILDRLYANDPAAIRTLCREPDAPATVVLWKQPAWATFAKRVVLPTPQLFPGQDPGEPWEVRRTMYLVTCDAIRSASLS